MERTERTQRMASANAAAAPRRGLGGGHPGAAVPAGAGPEEERGWVSPPISDPVIAAVEEPMRLPSGKAPPAWSPRDRDPSASWVHPTAARQAAARGEAVHTETLDALRSEVGELRARLSQAAPRRAVVEMDRAITLLHHQVEDMRGAGFGAGHEEMAYLAEELLELRTALDEMRAPERFQALSAGVEMLSRKIDILNARAVDPVEVARLQAQSAELKSLVSRTMSGAALQPLAERLAVCAEEVSRSSSEAAQRVVQATESFERNAEAIISRVDAYEANLRAEQGAVAEDLRRHMDASMEANVHGIHDRLDKVSEYLASLPPAVASELAGHLAPLLDRLDGARGEAPAASPLAEVVEHHLLVLTERFQDAHARLERLDDIEALLADMREEMHRVHAASAEATQEAVEVAVEAVSRKVSSDPAGQAVVGLKRGLAALEARQEHVERRASEILGENLARGLEDRTVELGRTSENEWVAHACVIDETPQPEDVFYDDAQAYEAATGHAAVQDGAAQDATAYEPRGYEDSAYDAPAYDVSAAAQDHGAGEQLSTDEGREPFVSAPDEESFRPFAPNGAEAAPTPRMPHDFFAEPGFAPDPQRMAAAPDLGEVRPDPVIPRTKKVQRGRSTADVQIPGRAAGSGTRPRVDRNRAAARRPMAARLSPAVIAAAALVILATATAGTAWTHRDTIKAEASRLMGEVGNPLAALSPSGVTTGKAAGAATADAAKSTADLPAPTGPQPLRTAALEGNLAAAYEEGVRFADGVGIPQDLDAGIKWLGYAVSRGYAPAGYRLGSLYENNLRNVDEAYRFYKWAAEQGNVRAMHNLAVLYSQGIEGNPDWSEALKWFRKAAELGLKDSQHNLGIIFARGFSGTSDLTEALTWFNIAARQGDQDSAEKRDALAREADQATLARARKAADAFVAKPMNEAANVVVVPPEWNASEAGEHVASNGLGANTLVANNMLFSGNPLGGKR